jgi:hypothetical protein
MASSERSRVDERDPCALPQALSPQVSNQGKKRFIRELNKTIVGDQIRELTGHIPANMEQVVVLEVSVTH